jgi:hypothetical protein
MHCNVGELIANTIRCNSNPIANPGKPACYSTLIIARVHWVVIDCCFILAVSLAVDLLISSKFVPGLESLVTLVNWSIGFWDPLIKIIQGKCLSAWKPSELSSNHSIKALR